jgi:hypothetical protein
VELFEINTKKRAKVSFFLFLDSGFSGTKFVMVGSFI